MIFLRDEKQRPDRSSCSVARSVQHGPAVPCRQSDSSVLGIHLLHGNLFCKVFVKAYLTVLSLGSPGLWDFLSLFLSFPDKSHLLRLEVKCKRKPSQILLQPATIAVIVAANHVKNRNRTSYADPAERRVLGGRLESRQ